MTVQEPYNPPFADVDMPETEVIVVAHPSPVFVDSTGRRSRLLRRIAYGFGALCIVYGGLISVSLAGGPVSSSAVLPLPDLTGDDEDHDDVVARPTPTPVPTSTTASRQPILEVFPRRAAPVTRRTTEQAGTPRLASGTPRPTRTPSAKPHKAPTTSPTTAKPVESGTTDPTTPATTPPPTEPTAPAPPAPPVPPPMPPAGGEGGGGATDEDDPAPAAPAAPAPADDPVDADPQPPATAPSKPVPEPPAAEPEPDPSDGAA